jgi:FAD/FMN-containing dehydrogenase
MTRVVVNPDTQTVIVQGGATWGDVSREVGRYPLAVNGGTVSMVGVGGLSLEGGYGYYAPQHGVTLDTIIAAKVVTGTGEIVSVSREENPDLFWAIRGAAPTVGVVYEFTFQAYPQPNPIWYGMRSFPASEVQSVAEALNTALFHPRGKAAAQCLLYLSPEDGKTSIVSTVLSHSPPPTARLFEDQVRLNGTASAIESDGHTPNCARNHYLSSAKSRLWAC